MENKQSDLMRTNSIKSAAVGFKLGTALGSTITNLGPVAECLDTVLKYKLEVKRLDQEIQIVKEQAKAINNAIDKTYELKIEELRHKRIAIIRFFDTVQEELSNLRIARLTVLEMAKEANQKAMSESNNEKAKYWQEYALELIKSTTLFGDNANQNLQTLVGTIPNIKTSNLLLGSVNPEDK